MTTNNNFALDEQFTAKCKIISLKYEYGIDASQPQWAIVSALSKEEIEQTFAAQTEKYQTYVVLTPDMGNAIYDYKKNDNKYFMRRLRNEQPFNFVDGETELYHTQLQTLDILDILCEEEINNETRKHINEALSVLSELQRKRIYQYFCKGEAIRNIAKAEGVDHKTVCESIQSSLKKMKKILKAAPKWVLPVGTSEDAVQIQIQA